MNILVIMGSPHKGESYSVVRKIETILQSLGDVQVDYLWLKDANLAPCRGCHACVRFGEEKCPLKDDMASIEARMLAADGVIFATPVYSNQVSYLLKILIDRLSYAWHRPRFFGKFAMGVASGGGLFGPTLGYIKETTTNWGFTYAAQLGATHPDALKPRPRARLERDIEKAARRFYEAVAGAKTPGPSLGRLIWFRLWRVNAQSCQQYIPADFKYWTEQGWFKRDYYTQAPVNGFQRVFAAVMEKALRAFMRSIYEGY